MHRSDEAMNSISNFPKNLLFLKQSRKTSSSLPLHICWRVVPCFCGKFFTDLYSVDNDEAIKRGDEAMKRGDEALKH
jgi:hypothetical protein